MNRRFLFLALRTYFMAALCSSCKGRGFCGSKRCIYLDRISAVAPLAKKVSTSFFGSSPPSVFVGRIGYPNVFAGALAPAEQGDTNLFDSPSLWAEKKMSIPDVLAYRTSLVNSRLRTNIKKKPKCLESIQEIAMAKKSVEFEAHYEKPVSVGLGFFTTSAPIGPSGNISNMALTENVRVARKVDSIVSDIHAQAKTSVIELFDKSLSENSIMKLFSVGLLGRKTDRKLVPTRWSITAVDDTLGKNIIDEIKAYSVIDSVQALKANYNGNYFWIILLPNVWSYELIEFGHEGAVWSNKGTEVCVTKDFENYFGRKKYASITAGGYYAARIGVLEYLKKIRKQASVLIVREILPDYFAPLGVWVVRETVRTAMKTKPVVFESANHAVLTVQKEMKAKKNIFQESVLLKKSFSQKMLSSFA